MRNLRFILACAAVMLLAVSFPVSMLYLGTRPAAGAASYDVTYVPVAARSTGSKIETVPENSVPEQPAQADASDAELGPEPRTDVLFAGNSLAVGLKSADGGRHDFICRTGISLPTLTGMVDGVSGHELSVIVMGSNEMGLWQESEFKSSYLALCEKLGGECLCLSVPPVCEDKSRYGERVNNKNAALYSSWIEDTCAGHDNMSYLDCSPFFGDSLDPALTGDGLHLNAAGYAAWLEWICGTANIA